MSPGLKTTFELLRRTPNEASVRALIPALDSPHRGIRDGALRTLLRRRSLPGHREILRRLHVADREFTEVVKQQRGRMTEALRDGLLGSDAQLCENACRAILWLREYDLIAALINVLEDESSPHRGQAAELLLKLVDLLSEEISGSQGPAGRRDPELLARNVVNSLELSVARFAKHGRKEVVVAFLRLVSRDNPTLREILGDPHHVVYLVVVDVLAHYDHPAVTGLLFSFLDDPNAPSGALSVIAKRGELPFVQQVLQRIGFAPSILVAQNLKRIKSIPWLDGDSPLLGQLAGSEQHAAVRLAMLSGIPRQQAYSTIEHLLLHGKPAGRRAAAEALADFNGAEANALALKGLEDDDPEVQANILAQLRHRGIPSALPRLVEMIDSPHRMVREAAQESLAEFSFKRYLGAFDMLEEEVRHSTGLLVKKIDPQTIAQLGLEFRSPSRGKRLRALAVAETMDVLAEVERLVIEMLSDADHIVRVRAASALGQCDSESAREALEKAARDPSVAVQQAAKDGLNRFARLGPGPAGPGDPRDGEGSER